MKLSKKKAVLILTIFMLPLVILQAVIIGSPYYYQPVEADGILILGYALEKETDQPDEWLTLRLQKGLELYKGDYGDKIIVSGGKGPRDIIAVAEGMKKWLVQQGVPEEHVLVEDRSKTTFQNIQFSKEIMEKQGIHSVVVVTNDFHIFRSMLIAKESLEDCSGAPAPTTKFFKKVFSYMREVPAVLKYVLVDQFRELN